VPVGFPVPPSTSRHLPLAACLSCTAPIPTAGKPPAPTLPLDTEMKVGRWVGTRTLLEFG
jgi:hypothetical protein